MKQGFFSRIIDNFLGRGSAAVTVPALDGAMKPNNLLEELPDGHAGKQPDQIFQWGGKLIWSDGCKLVSKSKVLIEFESEITALVGAGKSLVVATVSDGLMVFDSKLKRKSVKWDASIKNVTAVAYDGATRVWYCTGSTKRTPVEWRRDLMELNSNGIVGWVDLESGETKQVRSSLRYPSGIAVKPDGSVLYSEAWASHVVELTADGASEQVVLDEIPGYPGRISQAVDGGYWLCVFAPRNPLIELVLREPAYRVAMMNEIEEDLWVSPTYSSGTSFNEPMQGGALKQMGVLKPWAPTRSYGLVVELDENAAPIRSFHSRAGGRRHGITSAIESDGILWMTSRGSGEVVKMELGSEGAAA